MEKWDISYYSEKLKEDRYKFNEEELRPYFSLGVVLKGLQGSGKDRTIHILHLIIGKENDYIHRTSEIKELYGDFNFKQFPIIKK